MHTMVTLLYRTLQTRLGYDTAIRRTQIMSAVRNFAFEIEAKLLQIETQYILAAYIGTSHRPI